MNNKYILGIYSDEEKLVHTAQLLKKDGIKIYDIYTPFPLHGLDDALDITRSRLPLVTLVAGTCGLLLAMSFQVWTSAVDWPLHIGGKPLLSIPAFIPITFEITILLGALATVGAFFLKTNLFPGKEVRLMDHRQTDDQFIIALRRPDQSLEIEKISELLKHHGADHVKLVD